MEFYTISEKIQICTDIAKNLKEYRGKDGTLVNLFNETYLFVKPLKEIFKNYIYGSTFFRGTLEFVEISKIIEYHFPLTRNHQPLFVIRM